MPQEIISKKTKANLEILTKDDLLENFYLAGETGVALQLKHRVSLDLFFICKEVISLKNLLSLFKRKYKSVNYNMMHILKSLAYFEDAENNPMPKMILPVSWQEIKNISSRLPLG